MSVVQSLKDVSLFCASLLGSYPIRSLYGTERQMGETCTAAYWEGRRVRLPHA